MGKNFFQHKNINSSYRIRGKIPRIQMIEKQIDIIIDINIIDEILIFVNSINIIILINIIFIYSAIKIIANLPLKYSVLNPETSSLSPSIRSNGVRFNSAKILKKNIINSGIIVIKYQIKDWWFEIDIKLNDSLKIIGDIIIRMNLISYEIVWAIVRIIPIIL